jgi:hypothetical protein
MQALGILQVTAANAAQNPLLAPSMVPYAIRVRSGWISPRRYYAAKRLERARDARFSERAGNYGWQLRRQPSLLQALNALRRDTEVFAHVELRCDRGVAWRARVAPTCRAGRTLADLVPRWRSARILPMRAQDATRVARACVLLQPVVVTYVQGPDFPGHPLRGSWFLIHANIC